MPPLRRGGCSVIFLLYLYFICTLFSRISVLYFPYLGTLFSRISVLYFPYLGTAFTVHRAYLLFYFYFISRISVLHFAYLGTSFSRISVLHFTVPRAYIEPGRCTVHLPPPSVKPPMTARRLRGDNAAFGICCFVYSPTPPCAF